MFEAEFWVAVAFVIFVGVLGYFGVHKLMLKSIDDRRDRIKAELDEARRLKAEAQALLAAYQTQAARSRAARRKRSSPAPRPRPSGSPREAEAKHRGIRRTAHQDGGKQDRPGRSAGAGRRALRRRRCRCRGRRTILTRTVKDNVADGLLAKGIADAQGQAN